MHQGRTEQLLRGGEEGNLILTTEIVNFVHSEANFDNRLEIFEIDWQNKMISALAILLTLPI